MQHLDIVVPEPVEHAVDGKNRYFCPIPDCTREYATKTGYASARSFRNHFESWHLQSETVAVISRLDYGSPGFRAGAVRWAYEQAKKESVRFVIIAGGLVSLPHLIQKLTKKYLRNLASAHKFFNENGSPDTEAARSHLINKWAGELAEVFPRLYNESGHLVKTYIVTSPAPNYDGGLGMEVAKRLAQIRNDIFLWDVASGRFHLKKQGNVIWVLAPEKASWRSEYYSTAVDRLIRDKMRQTSLPLPFLWIVGCTASSLVRPAGESPRPWVSVPALHRLEEIHTSENQVGMLILEFLPGSSHFRPRFYNLKDKIANERENIDEPSGATETQIKVINELRLQPSTPGMLEDTLRIPRTVIAKEIKNLNDNGQPLVVYNDSSGKYDFSLEILQRVLNYRDYPKDELVETLLAAFGCLHALCVYTEYEFFIGILPQVILDYGIGALVGAGDFIEGMEHDLVERGEVIAGANYTQQERFAARMVATVMIKVFKPRFSKRINGRKRLSTDELTRLIDTCLLEFYYKEGNHDAWVVRKGVEPLQTFRTHLIDCTTRGVDSILKAKGWEVPYLRDLVENHIHYGETHTLPSGLGLTILHPWMARAKTSSLRAQGMLELAKTPVVVGANFHVAIAVAQWDSDMGQRVALQAGTIVWKTDFEHSKMKVLDTGVALLRILSHNGRIVMVEPIFIGEGLKHKVYDNEQLLETILDDLGILN